MDSIFQEEEQHLTETEGRLDRIISSYQEKADRLYKEEIEGAYPWDYDERDRIDEAKKRWDNYKKIVDEYQDYKPLPYYGRMDIAQSNNEDAPIETYYIGKPGIRDDEACEQLVLDWRSDIGGYFAAKNERKLHVKEYDYELLLRRFLLIEDGNLLDYNTEYDGLNIELEGDIVDPFLLKIMADKRRHHRMTDIIRTIQANQNDIIRTDEKQSFIVQGCAGSGKTMILLHRLSTLLFNNKTMDLSKVKILTPNEFFNMQIDELSRELELDQIERLTVEKFYIDLIEKYTTDIRISSQVVSEKGLNEQLLQVLYSEDFVERLQKAYDDHWDRIFKQLSESGTWKILQKSEDLKILPKQHHYADFARIQAAVKNSTYRYRDSQEKAKRLQVRLKAQNENVEKANINLDETCKKFDIYLDSVRAELEGKQKKYAQSVGIGRQQIEEHESSIKKKQNKWQNWTRTQTEFYRSLDLCNSIDMSKVTFQTLTVLPDKFLERDKVLRVREQCQMNLDQYLDDIRKTPIFNFSKKNKFRQAMKQEINACMTIIGEEFANYKIEIEQQIKEIGAQIQNITDEIDHERQLSIQLKRDNEELNEVVSIIGRVLQKFAPHHYPNFEEDFAAEQYVQLQQLIPAYQDYYKQWRNAEAQLRNENVKHLEIMSELEKLQAGVKLSDDEYQTISRAQDDVNKLSFSYIYENVLKKQIFDLYRSFQQKMTEQNYRHKIYLTLQFCSMYYEDTFGRMFLNVDEAQDLSLAEYRLMRKILGKNSIFNLYGDVNQLVYAYKGIQDWTELDQIITNNIFVLNENYRNTLQVTKYCNQKFDADVYPIGISGPEVIEEKLDLAVQKIVAYKADNPPYRTAILYRSGETEISNRLRDLLKGQDISWNRVADQKISIITVEMAKGLEFEGVLVCTQHMNSNEKYISYTRSLDALIVANEM